MVNIGISPLLLHRNIAFKGTNTFNTNVSNLINTDRMTDTFVKLAKQDTGSDPVLAETKTPSTSAQTELANDLAQQLKEMKLQDVEVDKYGIVTATLPSNTENNPNSPVIGLLAHMDTSSSVPTGPVNPQIHKYQGGDIHLKEGTVISAGDLNNHKGENIITSDGSTLLGADDKAGITEILEALRVFNEHPELKHPKVRIAFTPDEETGTGTEKFDIKKFGADVAYTVDGEDPTDVETENFNSFNPEITIHGKTIHTGSAYGKMINSVLIANELINALPPNETPATTRDKEGFFHVAKIDGDESQIKLNIYVRDFDYQKAKERVELLKKTAKELEEKYPGCKININPNEKSHNMKEKLNECPEAIEYAKEGIRRSGLNPEEKSIRGGTDGSKLTMENLPTPNLGAGGVNFHSKNEFVSVQDMKKCTENIINILSVWSEKSEKAAPKMLEKREKNKDLNLSI